MKRNFAFILVIAMVLSIFLINRADIVYAANGTQGKSIVAVPTASKVIVDGENISFDAYLINDNNYFKLRDLATVVNGTQKQFEVTWDGNKRAINLISSQAYTKVGGELTKGTGVKETPQRNTAIIYKDGVEVNLLAYTINDLNYFKLRDIAKAFDIGVTWDGVTQTVGIDTSISYGPEETIKPVSPPNFSTEEGIRDYLIGDWSYEERYIRDITCDMNIDKDLNVSLSFENSYSNAPKGQYKGKITFDRMYVEANEAPDIISLELFNTDEPGGDFLFLHRTIYDNKRVMSWFFAGNGNSIFDVADFTEEFVFPSKEVMFEKRTGEKSPAKALYNDAFHAVFWGLGSDGESLWLDDVIWTPNDGSYAPIYPVEMTNYQNDIKGSVLYSLVSKKVLEDFGYEMTEGEVYYVETNSQGKITYFISADEKEWIENNYITPEITADVINSLTMYDEPYNILSTGMSYLFEGDTVMLDGEEFYVVFLGTDHGEYFVKELHYAVDTYTGEVYWYNVPDDIWEQLGMG